MLLGSGYWYKFMFCFFLSFQKAENNRFKKKTSRPKFCNIIFLLLLKTESVRLAEKHINLVSPYGYISCL